MALTTLAVPSPESSHSVNNRHSNGWRALVLRISRGDKTAIELFLSGLDDWGSSTRQLLPLATPISYQRD
jgi:hypothetical protein